MTLVLADIKQATDSAFEKDPMTVPTPPVIWKDRLEALDGANLAKQRAACLFDMRKWQAEKMGFKQVNSDDLVTMLMGEPFTESDSAPESERQTYEWAYDHHHDCTLGKDWGGLPHIWRRRERKGKWCFPPFTKTTIWEVQFGKLDYLKRDIPYGVVLRINETKTLKLFNAFNVMAPMEAWRRKTDIDPIVVASIWELPPRDDGKPANSAGQVSHYFLAQW
jgi:hypothetical protein